MLFGLSAIALFVNIMLVFLEVMVNSFCIKTMDRKKLKKNINENKKVFVKKTKEVASNIKGFFALVKNYIFTKLLNKKNISRDSIIVIAVVIMVSIIIGISKYNYIKKVRLIKKADNMVQNHVSDEFHKQSLTTIKSVQDQINTDNWKDYKTQWYGFSIKYPDTWRNPIPGISARKFGEEYRYRFRKADVAEDSYVGFDVAIYSVNKTKEFTSTGEFPSLKSGLVEGEAGCETIEGHLIETGDYPAEEVYVPLDDNCYKSVLFFSVTKGEYIYNIVPVVQEGVEIHGDSMVEIADNFPEFFAAISFFENTDIVRPKPKPSAVANAPKPVSYKKDSLGRRVCAKDHDKPAKSKTHKKKHLDMECCLDPDEYPNPHCYYSPGKYGKYLK